MASLQPSLVSLSASLLLPALPTLHRLASTQRPHTFFVPLPYSDSSKAQLLKNSGVAVLFASTAQQLHDLGAAAHLAALESGVPVVIFYSPELEGEVELAPPTILAGMSGKFGDKYPVEKKAEQKSVLRRATNPAFTSFAATLARISTELHKSGLTTTTFQSVSYHGPSKPAQLILALAPVASTLLSAELGVVAVNVVSPWPEHEVLDAVAKHGTGHVVVAEVEGEGLFVDVA